MNEKQHMQKLLFQDEHNIVNLFINTEDIRYNLSLRIFIKKSEKMNCGHTNKYS